MLEDAENTRKENFALNLDMYRTLRETASACGVTIAIPNTVGYNELKKTGAPNICSSAGKLNELIDELGGGFCACLDTSRAYYAGQLPWKTAELLGARLKVLRLADNDGKGAEKLMVTGGYVVWKNLTTALQTIGYQGALTFDPDYLRSGESALLPLGKLACAIGTDFIQEIKK